MELNELMESLGASRERLRRAIRDGAQDWDRPAQGGEWTVRATVEHALGADLDFARTIGGAIGAASPAEQELAFATADEALQATGPVFSASDEVLKQVTSESLEQSSPILGNVFGTLVLAAHHLNLHALQVTER